MKCIKTAQYHDATNHMRHLIFSRYFPWKSPKRLSTMMLQMTDVISNFHGNSHAILQNGSVPRCYKSHASSHFFAVFPMKITKTAQYHDATNSRFYLQFSWYFPWNASKRLSTTMLQMTCSISIFPWYFPWISPKQLSTMMLQMTDLISIFHGISHEFHKNSSVPRCYK